jgi:hypothetical protein
VADQYNTISHTDLSGGIDTRNSEDKLRDGYSEAMVNLDTTTTGQIKLRSGYSQTFGYVPIRVIAAQVSAKQNENVFRFQLEDKIDVSLLELAGNMNGYYYYRARFGIYGALVWVNDSVFNIRNGMDWLLGQPNADKIKVCEGWVLQSTTDVKDQFLSLVTSPVLDFGQADQFCAVPEMFIYGLRLVGTNKVERVPAFPDSIETTNELGRPAGKALEALAQVNFNNAPTLAAVASKSLFIGEGPFGPNAEKVGTQLETVYVGKLLQSISTTARAPAFSNNRGTAEGLTADLGATRTEAEQLSLRTVLDSGIYYMGGLGLIQDPRIPITAASFSGSTGTLTFSFPSQPTKGAIPATLQDIEEHLCPFGSVPSLPTKSSLPIILSAKVGSVSLPTTVYMRSVASFVSDPNGSTLVVNVDLASSITMPAGVVVGTGVFNYDFVCIQDLLPWDTSLNYIGDKFELTGLTHTVCYYDRTLDPYVEFAYTGKTTGLGSNFVAAAAGQLASFDRVIDCPAGNLDNLGFSLDRVGDRTACSVTGIGPASVVADGITSIVLGLSAPGKIIRAPFIRLCLALDAKMVNPATVPVAPNTLDGMLKITDASTKVGVVSRQIWIKTQFASNPYTIGGATSGSTGYIIRSILGGDTISVEDSSGVTYDMTFISTTASSELPANALSLPGGGVPSIRGRLFPALSSVYKNLVPVTTQSTSQINPTIGVGELDLATLTSEETLKACGYLGSWKGIEFLTGTDASLRSQSPATAALPKDMILNFEGYGVYAYSVEAPTSTMLADADIPSTLDKKLLMAIDRDGSIGANGAVPAKTKMLPITKNSTYSASITATKGSVYACSGLGSSVYKYDGKSTAPAGAIDWYPGLIACAAPDVAGLSPSVYTVAVTSAISPATIKVGVGAAATWTPGQMLQFNDAAKTIVSVVNVATDTGADTVTVSPGIPAGLPTSITVLKMATYRYYFRLTTTDANGNRTVGAAVQSEDMIVALGANSAIRLQLLAPPRLAAYDLSNVDIEIYRTQADTRAPYYFISAVPVDFSDPSKYITYLDQTPDSQLGVNQLDAISGVSGAEKGIGFCEPMAGNYMASTNSRLFVADYNQPEQVSLVVRQNPNKAGVSVGAGYLDSIATNVTALSKGDAGSYVAGMQVNSLVTNVSPKSDTLSVTPGTSFYDYEVCGSHFVAKTTQRTYAFIDPQPITLGAAHPYNPAGILVRPEMYGLHACRNASSAGLSHYEFAGGLPIKKYKYYSTAGTNKITVKSGNSISCNINDGDTVMFNAGLGNLSTSKVYKVKSRAVAGNDVTFQVSEVWPTYDATNTAVVLTSNSPVFPSNFVVSKTLACNGTIDADSSADIVFTVASPTAFRPGEMVELYKLEGNVASPATLVGWVKSVATTPGAAPAYKITLGRDSITAVKAADVYRIRPNLGVQALQSAGTDLPLPTGQLACVRDMIATENVTDGKQVAVYAKRMAQFLNMAYSAFPTSLMPNATKSPIVAKAGNDYTPGQITLKSLDGSPISVVIPPIETLGGDVAKAGARANVRVMWYVDGKKASKDGVVNSVSSSSKRWLNRVAISIKEYPEIFDRPYEENEVDSTGFVDVSSDDGSTITGILPFFGKSSFTAAQQEPALIVFKSNSIYLIDVNERTKKLASATAERNGFLNKLQSNGVGCSYPNAFTEVSDGVVFIHTSGVYKLTRDFRVVWIGEKLDGLYKSAINDHSVVSCVTWPYKQKAIIGYNEGSPTVSYKATSQVVYDYSRERTLQSATSSQDVRSITETADGSWTTYSGIPMVGAAPYKDSIMSIGWDGQLYEILPGKSGVEYRDNGAPISFSWTYKACDFGDSGRRKVAAAVVTSLKSLTNATNIQVEQAVDMSRTFSVLADRINIDMTDYKVISVRSSLKDRKFNHLQLRYTGSSLANPIEFTGLDFSISGLTFHGVRSAADS